MLTSLFNEKPNEILCNSKLLENYLRTTYSNYKFISSTTKDVKTGHDINEETEKYDLVVLDYTLNKNVGLLKKIKHPEKIEILCNEVCQENCPNRQKHYKTISEAILYDDTSLLPTCEFANTPFYKVKTRKHFISKDEINDFLNKGILNFKLVGRHTGPFDLVEILLYYLIKDEYQDEMRHTFQEILLTILNQTT